MAREHMPDMDVLKVDAKGWRTDLQRMACATPPGATRCARGRRPVPD
jgi:hypothetical protein